MLIGILQTGRAPDDLRPGAGDYPDMFQAMLAGHGFDFRTWRVLDMEFPSGPRDAGGWLITGSRHGTYEDLPFIRPLEDFIRDAYALRVPMVGVCFGHQIIAQALGGKVEKFAGGWAVGPQDYAFGDERVTLNAWHQDQITARPPEASLLATAPFCENAALIYGDRALTVQAHPEFSDAFIAGLMDKRGRGMVPDPLMAAAAARLGQGNDSGRFAARIAAFFKQARE